MRRADCRSGKTERRAADSIEDVAMREAVENGLRALQIAWAQA
ncbi:hypothetical protein ACLUS7_14235 [Enterobacterales bacterium BD_CKDN230030183-1A_HGKHYDSX7]